MGTAYRRTSPFAGGVATSARYLIIATSPVTQIIMSSGNQGLSIYNLGTGNLIWGSTDIAVNSGNYLFVNARVEWLGLQDQFSVYTVADSVQTLVAVTEYQI